MGLFNHLITTKLETKKEARYNSPELYLEYLTFLGHTGKVDQIYFSIRLLDKSFIDSQKNFFDKSDVFLRLENLIKRIEDKNQYGIKNFLIKNNDEKVEIYKTVEMYFKGLQPDTASHEQNFILNFMLNMLIEHKLLNTDLAKSLVEYFWKAKNCNNYRKDFSIFSIVDYCFDHNMQDFFALRKQFYNHIQKIYNQIYKSVVLDSNENKEYQRYIANIIKKFNNLNSLQKPKIAVCIAGLYRNHENALESIRKNVAEPLNADVFVHTWDEMSYWTGIGGFSFAERIFGSRVKAIIPKEINDLKNLCKYLPYTYDVIKSAKFKSLDKEKIHNLLQPKKIITDNQEKFLDAIGNKESYKSRESFNQIKMFYGLKQVFECALNENKYDYIIRLRPDLYIHKPFEYEQFLNLDQNTIYTHVGDFGVQDVEFTLSTSMAHSLTKFISKMFEIEKLSPYEDYPLYDAHNLFFSWLLENDYKFGRDLVEKRTLLNMSENKIILEGLKEALDKDSANLLKDNKTKFSAFIDFLRQDYCE